jgi:hypothetical protein
MNLKLVDNKPDYFEFIRELRLHPKNILGFINQNKITKEEQIEYMKIYQDFFKVCLMENVPVGFVGVIDNDIRVAVNPDLKKMGIGKFMIEQISKLYPDASAKIKVENDSSIKLFKSCGFKPTFLIMKK